MHPESKCCLFVSPHLDDVAFSCGGTLSRLAALGRRVVLCTVFSGRAEILSDFALQCQTDKGIPLEVDYVALRKAEDRCFARLAGVDRLVWLDFLEAPHRGYDSSASLFAGIGPEDVELVSPVAQSLLTTAEAENAREIYGPVGIGGHVDHLLTRQAIQEMDTLSGELFHFYLYEELPYALRSDNRTPESAETSIPVLVTEWMDKKIQGIGCYQSQVEFQFGDETAMSEQIRQHARDQALHRGYSGYAEVFWRL